MSFDPGQKLTAAELNNSFSGKQSTPILPADVPGVAGVTVSGIPTIGQAIIATADNAAAWQSITQGTLVPITAFGCVSDETSPGFDNTTFFQNAINSGEGLFIPPNSTFLVEGLIGRANMAVFGFGDGSTSTIKLTDFTAANVLQFTNCSNFYLGNFTIDGNKSNQTPGQANSRGFAVIGTSYNWVLNRLSVNNTLDHGLFCSLGGDINVGQDAIINACISRNCGSAAHTSAGGQGGTAFATGGTRMMMAQNRAYGAHLNGFKADGGTFYDCAAIQCGGGFETGFDPSPIVGDTTYIACRALSCTGNGWRHQGQGIKLIHLGCRAELNGQSGIMLLGPVTDVIIDGCDIRNNGQLAPVRNIPAGTGLEGISVYNNSNQPQRILISNSIICDDQVIPTQAYGVMIPGPAGYDVVLDKSNIITGNVLGSHFLGSTSRPRIEEYFGSSVQVNDQTPITVTGIVGDANLVQILVPANTLVVGSRLEIKAVGTVTGTNNVKTIRITIGAASQVLYSGNFTDDWFAEYEIEVTPQGYWLGTGLMGRVNSAIEPIFFIKTSSLTVSGDNMIGFNVTMGDAGDAVTQTYMHVRSVY